MNSKRKGKTGELELAQFLRDHGFPARRGRQFRGGPESPDVVVDGLPYHWECKRVERGNLHEWAEQAERESGGRPWIVAHRRSRSEWLAIVPLSELLKLIHKHSQV